MVRLHTMLLTQLLTLSLLSSLCGASEETQVFRSQPGDITVQAGDKVRRGRLVYYRVTHNNRLKVNNG